LIEGYAKEELEVKGRFKGFARYSSPFWSSPTTKEEVLELKPSLEVWPQNGQRIGKPVLIWWKTWWKDF